MTGRHEAWRDCGAEVWAPSAPEMAALDHDAVERGLASERTLIEAAGRELARRVAESWSEGPVCGLVGSGHNGADTMVALRTLAAWGRDVRAVGGGSGPPEPDVRAGWPIELESPESFAAAPPIGGVVVDGLLGTGASGAPRPPQAELIERTNSLGLPIVAADLPSGADPTTGAVPGACVRADCTVCFGWPKLGLLRYPAREFAGRIEAVEIGFPPVGTPPGARIITARWVRELLRPRRPDGHKGTSGYLLLAAGSRGMAGAAVLAGRAAYRTGAGIVRVLGDPDNRDIVQRAVPGAVYVPWASASGDVAEQVAWAHALAIGPGLGQAAERRALLDELLELRGERPAVIDADGLNLYAERPAALADRLTPADVITPHPGEFERLLGRPTGEDPTSDAREAAGRFGCVVVLKGNPTVAAAPAGAVRVAVTGGSAFAVGGTGDVLTGAIGAALAAGYEALDAATIALLLTGLAAGRTGFGDIGMVAEDIPEAIPAARDAVEALGPMPAGAVRFVLPPGSRRPEGVA
ncbi:MAG TPA: NAD(P)H-hydrate dehydratase [Gemmatimonadota bacterium]|nr:NAD(P)H-hydrate dehydratase [Gemmatimonadota bacterium]